MPEPDPRADLQQPVRRSGLRRRSRDLEPPGRPPHQHSIACRLGRRDEHQRPRVGGQRLDPSPEALLDPGRDRLHPRQPEPARQLREAQPARQLQQRQRVTVRFVHDPVPHPLIEPEPDHRAQQRLSVMLRQASHLQVRQPPERLTRLARGEDHPDRLGQQPPSPRTPAPAPTPGPAIGRHRPRTTAAGPPPPPTATSAPPARP